MGPSLYILGYSEPAVVGTTVSFNCSQPGEVLTDPNTATCMEDGQWAPDPSQLQISCKGDSRCMLSPIYMCIIQFDAVHVCVCHTEVYFPLNFPTA